MCVVWVIHEIVRVPGGKWCHLFFILTLGYDPISIWLLYCWTGYFDCPTINNDNIITSWWFQIFVTFALTWGNNSIWLIFFKWVEGTHQPDNILIFRFFLEKQGKPIGKMTSAFSVWSVSAGSVGSTGTVRITRGRAVAKNFWISDSGCQTALLGSLR